MLTWVQGGTKGTTGRTSGLKAKRADDILCGPDYFSFIFFPVPLTKYLRLNNFYTTEVYWLDVWVW